MERKEEGQRTVLPQTLTPKIPCPNLPTQGFLVALLPGENTPNQSSLGAAAQVDGTMVSERPQGRRWKLRGLVHASHGAEVGTQAQVRRVLKAALRGFNIHP